MIFFIITFPTTILSIFVAAPCVNDCKSLNLNATNGIALTKSDCHDILNQNLDLVSGGLIFRKTNYLLFVLIGLFRLLTSNNLKYSGFVRFLLTKTYAFNFPDYYYREFIIFS